MQIRRLLPALLADDREGLDRRAAAGGPYRVDEADWYQAGSTAGEIYRAGSTAGQADGRSD